MLYIIPSNVRISVPPNIRASKHICPLSSWVAYLRGWSRPHILRHPVYKPSNPSNVTSVPKKKKKSLAHACISDKQDLTANRRAYRKVYSIKFADSIRSKRWIRRYFILPRATTQSPMGRLKRDFEKWNEISRRDRKVIHSRQTVKFRRAKRRKREKKSGVESMRSNLRRRRRWQ